MARRTGAIAAAGVLVAIGATVFTLKTLESHYVVLRSYTDDAGGLSEGTSVRLNGIAVGYLDKLLLTNSLDPKRKIEFEMKVRRSHLSEIPDDSLVGVQPTNLLGNYYIDIMRGQSRRPVQPGAELRTVVAIDPNRLLGEMASEFQQITAIFDRANRLITAVQEGQGNIGMWGKQGTRKFDAVASDLQKLENDITNGHGTTARLKDVGAAWDSAQKRIDDLMGAYQAGQGTAGKSGALSTEIQQTSAEANRVTAEWSSENGPASRISNLQDQFGKFYDHAQDMLDRMNSGQGAAGQFQVNTQLSQAISGASADFQQLAKDIRANPRKVLGFSFHLF